LPAFCTLAPGEHEIDFCRQLKSLINFSSYMGFATNVWLYPRFVSSSSDMAFPAMTCVYVCIPHTSAPAQDVLNAASIFSTSAQSWRLFMEWMRLWLTKTTKVTPEVGGEVQRFLFKLLAISFVFFHYR
jgi:hypothetical protein